MNTLESNKAAAVSVDMEAIDQQILGYAYNSFRHLVPCITINALVMP